MKDFLNKKIGNEITGIMPMWFYLSVITIVIIPFILKALNIY